MNLHSRSIGMVFLISRPGNALHSMTLYFHTAIRVTRPPEELITIWSLVRLSWRVTVPFKAEGILPATPWRGASSQGTLYSNTCSMLSCATLGLCKCCVLALAKAPSLPKSLCMWKRANMQTSQVSCATPDTSERNVSLVKLSYKFPVI